MSCRILRRCLPCARNAVPRAIARGIAASREHHLVHLWADGKQNQWQGTSKELMLLFGLSPRDVRLFGTKGAHLSIRAEYFLFRLPPFTGCVWSDSVMILSERKGRAAELFSSCLQKELSLERTQPFEFLVLEMALRESFVEKEDRFTRLSALIDQALRLRAAANDTQLRLRDFLAPSLSRATREHSLYTLLMLSNSLSTLEVDVRRHESCIENVLKSDEDMAAMYLTYRRDSGSQRKVSDHQDVELLLESFGMMLEDLRDRIQKVQEGVITQSKMEQLMLTSERNRIMRLELLMGMGTSSMAVSTMIAGFFGMNLASGWEEVPGLFWITLAGSAAFSLILFRAFMGGIRRYHHLQRKHLSEVTSLNTALRSLDEAYFQLRKKSALALFEEDALCGAVGKTDLLEALREAGCQLTQTEEDLLWEAMDANQDGMLSPSELGITDRDAPKAKVGSIRV